MNQDATSAADEAESGVIPRTRTELLEGLSATHLEIEQAFSDLPLEVFLAPQGPHWSPAGHLRHLVKSVKPVAKALSMPRLALVGIGGVSRGPSRSFEEVRGLYMEALAAGGQAGRYGPSDREITLPDAEWRAVIIERFRGARQDLDQVLGKWDDRALDRYRLPHPLLGKLTVREMLFFTMYHGKHHLRRVFERFEKS